MTLEHANSDMRANGAAAAKGLNGGEPPAKGARIFADNAINLSEHDLSVMPLNGKVPAISGFDRWKSGPTDAGLRNLTARFPDANIGIHTRSSVLAILDGDDAATFSQIRECVADTPLRTRTRRGGHLYFRLSRDLRPRNLRQIGINADLKGPAVNDYVVAPPSAHPDDMEFRYALDDGCDWAARYDLPILTSAAIDYLIEHFVGSHEKADQFRCENLKPGKRSTMSGPLSVGERALALNDRLCREAAHCDDFDSLLDCAYTINEACDVSLPEAEIISVAGRVWGDCQSGKLEQWTGRSGRSQTTRREVFDLAGIGVMGLYGLALLDILKIDHMARVRRGASFFLNAEGMAKSEVIPGWDRNAYRRATKALLDSEAIKFVGWGRPEGAKRAMKLYTFGPSVLGQICAR